MDNKGFNSKLTRDELEDLADYAQYTKEYKCPGAGFTNILCHGVSVLTVIAIVVILAFIWRSCAP